ncbi:proteasome accessory factor PafA2 family protein [Novipirellula sp. SH528]|uniref:proteasome accessory factor PafA2 family protein n=1 Tax=Novipirellula sp. SH528 TaxID=3454466 RepID=UPI003FA18454
MNARGSSDDRTSATSASRKRTTALVSRLMGMETEYATIAVDPQNLSSDDLPASLFVYEQICEAIRRDQPTAKGLFDSEQMFLASGGAVTFESNMTMHDAPGGLIEIATPEVRSPEELLTCQRSIDQLVSDATADSETSYDLRVLKNSSDAYSHVYGCQENYEADVANGVWLLVYRLFVCLLWMMQVVSLIASVPLLWLLMTIGWIAQRRKRTKAAKDSPVHTDAAEEDHFDQDAKTTFDSVPPTVTWIFVEALRWIHLPIVLVLRFVARHIAFRPQRRYLTALLASRLALCGSGALDYDGRYRLSIKAMAIDTIADMGGFRGERPVFVYGHWLSHYCAKTFLSLASTRIMFARRQRLQIGLSDSNMADHAEYVKFASVSLVLDMIESGAVADLPVLKDGVASIHRIASDWNLVSSVPTSKGQLSALEIQRKYFLAAKQFVAETSNQWLGESETVLERWESLIDVLAAFRQDHAQTSGAVGRVDWLTKHNLIEALGDKAEWTDKKKIDLRYHELSSEGYFQQLLLAKPEVIFVDQKNVDRRRRSPPSGSPAARRGWIIREFAGGEEMLHTDWTHAMIGRGRKRKRVNFDL